MKNINKPKGPALGDHFGRQYFTFYPKRTKFDIASIFDFTNFKSKDDLYLKRLLFLYLNCNYNCNFPQCEVNVKSL